MLTRLVLRPIVPTTYQIAKILTGNNLKQQCLKYSTLDLSRPVDRLTCVPRRLYCEQVVPESTVVDYEYVKNSIADSNKVIVDVREPDEIKEHGKIPNSINIPLGHVDQVLQSMSDEEFKKTFGRQKPSSEDELIFYCQSGRRATEALDLALKSGFTKSKSYIGSWNEWSTKNKG